MRKRFHMMLRKLNPVRRLRFDRIRDARSERQRLRERQRLTRELDKVEADLEIARESSTDPSERVRITNELFRLRMSRVFTGL